MQPERHIEKLLHAFARKRRDQAGGPLDLHPATRRLLQGEVARQYGRPHASPSAGWLAWTKFWPRIAFATVTLAILAVGVFVLLPPTHTPPSPLTLAQHEPATRDLASVPQPVSPRFAAPDSPSAPAVAFEESEAPDPGKAAFVAGSAASGPVATSTRAQHFVTDVSADKSFIGRDVPRSLDDLSPPAQVRPGRAPLATAAPTERKRSVASSPSDEARVLAKTDSVARRFDRSESPRSAGVSTALTGGGAIVSTGELPPAAVFSPRESLREKADLLGAATPRTVPRPVAELLVQQFKQVEVEAPRGTRRIPEAVPVLTAFKLEQRGSEIRIVDADGSVYTGVVATGSAPAAADRARPKSFLARGGAEKPRVDRQVFKTESRLAADVANLQPTLLFSVRGTNTTLRQAVVFTGNVQSVSEAVQLGISNQAVGIAGRTKEQSPAQTLLQNTRLSGRARLSDGRELEIHAETVPDDPK